MKISFQGDTQREAFYAFQHQAFPQRARLNDKLTTFRYYNPLNNGNFATQNILAVDGSQIIGQALYHPNSYYFKNELRQAEWGFDFYVQPDRRNDTPGIHILEFARNNKGTLFATGVGEKALKIHKAFGYSVIGHLKKFVKLTNPFFLPFALLRRKNIPAAGFPDKIDGEVPFVKVQLDQLWDNTAAYNPDLIEFARDKAFMGWRFFSDSYDYVVYKSEAERPLFFVVRTVKIKGITSLILADYRFDLNRPEEFESILSAVQKLTRKLWLPVIASGSSNAVSDAGFETNGFKINGKDRPIVCNDKSFKSCKEQINSRKFVFVTLADSDGEYSL